jgi:hypothetical protein
MNNTMQRRNPFPGLWQWLRAIPLRSHWIDFLFVIFLAAFSTIYLTSLAAVPFHPDEATQMFMSSDLTTLFTHPFSLAWQNANAADARMLYRELDAPLARYLDGAGLAAAGIQPPVVDWDWSKTWAQNSQNGALPSSAALLAARLPTALLFPIGLILLYLTGQRISRPSLGLLAVLALAVDGVVALHTRRAMAEGALIFSVILFLYVCLCTDRPWLLGLCAGLTFCAKQSTLPLALVGLIAVVWRLPAGRIPFIQIASRLLAYLATCLGLILLLNPFLWAHPLSATESALHARQQLLTNQIADTRRLMPSALLVSPLDQWISLTAQVYYLPPAFEEVANYQAQVSAQASEYAKTPFANAMRGSLAGSTVFFFSLAGFIFGIIRLRRNSGSSRGITLLIVMTVAQVLALVYTLPFGWQRYYLPVFPFMALWAGYGLCSVAEVFLRRVPPRIS